MSAASEKRQFDTGAAVTRSLLGWGVVAGPFYLVVGATLALTRSGFELAEHPLSLLMVGEHGWLQTTNLALSGLMTLAAAVGFRRALPESRAGRVTAILLGVYGLCVVASAVFEPDPMAGFPAGADETVTTAGMLHFVFGAIGFLAAAVAAFVLARWFAERGADSAARWSRVAGAIVVVGFFGGGAMSSNAAGVGLLWIAVVTIWTWLLLASLRVYATVPHPDGPSLPT